MKVIGKHTHTHTTKTAAINEMMRTRPMLPLGILVARGVKGQSSSPFRQLSVEFKGAT